MLVRALTPFRVGGALLFGYSLYLLFSNFEQLSSDEGWGVIAVLAWIFCSVVAIIVDVLMRIFIKDGWTLAGVQLLALLGTYLFFDW